MLHLLGLAFCLATVSAHRALSVSLTDAHGVADASRVPISATVTNTGDETLKLLNYPKGVLSPAPADTFTISHSGGATPRFRGLAAKYVPKAGKKSTTLEPGESITVTHILADAYDFSTSGPGAYEIRAWPVFSVVVEDDCIETVIADGSPYTTQVAGNLMPRVAPPETPLAAFTNCSARRQTALTAAAAAADALSKAASTYVSTNTVSTPRYAAWFGNLTAARHATVAGILRTLAGTSFGTYTYTCLTDEQCDPLGDAPGYVLPALKGRVYVCPDFFDAEVTGAGSQGGALVGLAALWGGAADLAQDDDDARDLALGDPDVAVYNAPSYEYFAENTDPVLQ